MQNRLIISSQPSLKTLNVKGLKFIKHLIAKHTSNRNIIDLRIIMLKNIKTILHLEIYEDDASRKRFYLKIVKKFQKYLEFFKSVNHRFPRYIRKPSKYELDISSKFSWYHFFHLSSLKQLDLYNNYQGNQNPNTLSKKVINNFKRHKKCMKKISLINIEGHVLNDYSKKIITELFRTWQDSESLGSINLKIWDYSRQFFSVDPIIESRTYFLKFVNRCGDFNHIANILKMNFEFKNIYKLEFWTRISEDREFKPLKIIKHLKSLKEIRARFELEGDLEETSMKLIRNLSFPESLEILNLLVVSLRLEWRKRVDEEFQEKTFSMFIKSFKALQNLREFYFNLHDLEIDDTFIIPKVIEVLPSLKNLYISMGSPDLDWKQIKKYEVLDLGFWVRNHKEILKGLRVFFMDVQAITMETLNESDNCLKNIEFISLNNKILEKVKINSFLRGLDPEKIKGIYMGETPLDAQKELIERFELLKQFSNLENLTFKIALKESISADTFRNLLSLLANMINLKRLTLRLEKSVILKENWELELEKLFKLKRNMNLMSFYSKNGKLELVRE